MGLGWHRGWLSRLCPGHRLACHTTAHATACFPSPYALRCPGCHPALSPVEGHLFLCSRGFSMGRALASLRLGKSQGTARSATEAQPGTSAGSCGAWGSAGSMLSGHCRALSQQAALGLLSQLPPPLHPRSVPSSQAPSFTSAWPPLSYSYPPSACWTPAPCCQGPAWLLSPLSAPGQTNPPALGQ